MRLLVGLLALAAALEPSPQVVRIDLVALDSRGRVLENLKASDFDVRDDGVAQPVEDARFVRVAADSPRLVAIFLDEYHVTREGAARVREPLNRFVNNLAPGDILVIMKPLDSLFAIKPVADRDAAHAAIAVFEGRRDDYEARTSYERNFMAGVPARIDAQRTQVAVSAINALALHFNSHPDLRKTVLVVSEGMKRLDRRRGYEFVPTVDTIIRSAQRMNASIYAINPGAPVDESDSIRVIAAETAGGSIESDLDAGLRRVLDDTGGYYVLSYRALRPDDGKFHPVQVDIKRSGVQLRARKGYYAPSPDEALRDAVVAKMNELKTPPPVEPAPHASPFIRPWFGTSRAPDGKTRITFVWEPARQSPTRTRRMPARVTMTALAPDNSVLFEGVVLPAGPLIGDGDGTPRTRAVFDMPPGRLRTRMSIEDAALQVVDTDVRSITVRDMGRGIAIGTPEVLRARNAREFRALESGGGAPSASREFSRTERLLIRFTVYDKGVVDSGLTVSARLMSRMGPMRALPINASGGVNSLDVPLAGLAAGEYLIEVTATGAGGEAKDVIDFRVTT